MKKLQIYGNKFTLVDEEDYEYLSKFKWYSTKKGHVYRNASLREGSQKSTIYMHRELMNAEDDFQVDHINNNPLDNRKSNLRIVTHKQNLSRVGKSKKQSTSLYKGVCWVKSAKAWQAAIRIDGKSRKIGHFHDEKVAAAAYNHYAKEQHGEFAYLNDVPNCDWESQIIPNKREGTGKSKYIGVSYRAKYGDWQCHIMVNYKSIYLGKFENEIDAAKAYNEAAVKYRGDKAKLNTFD